MEKIRNSIKKNLPPLRLYLDELREVYEELSKHCEEPVTIQTCGYRLDNLDELGKLPAEQTNELFIHCLNPYLQIRLAPTHGEIYIGDDDIKSEGLASRIEKILLKGKVLYPALPKSNWISFLFVTPLAFGIFLGNKILIFFGVSILLVVILWGWLNFEFVTKRYNTIVFKSRKEAPNFWKRNKDEIIMLVVGTLFGVIITKVIDLLIK